MRRTDVTDPTKVAEVTDVTEGTDVTDVTDVTKAAEVTDEAAARVFVLDDRIFEGQASAAPGEPLFHLDDAEDVPVNDFDAAAGRRPTDIAPTNEGFVSVPPVMFSHPTAAPTSRRILSPSFWLLGTALLLIGVVLFVFQRGYFDARTADVITPLPSPTIVLPVVVPPVPKKTVQRPANRAIAAPPLKNNMETATAGAPIMVPHAPKPEVPKPDAPVVPAPPAPPSRPDPPPIVEVESVPNVVVPSETKSDEEGWFNLAEEYLQMGDENRAEALYRRILKEGTRQGQAALALGDLFAKRNDFDRAQEFYRQSKLLFQSTKQQTSKP